jgi:hypothetical protein
MQIKRIVAALGATIVALTAVMATAAPASATDRNGVLEVGEFGLFYTQNQGGPVMDLFNSDANFSGQNFPGTSISANDNTESYWNRDSFWWHVFTNANYTGSHGCLPAGYSGNASATFTNTISSAYWSSSSC